MASPESIPIIDAHIHLYPASEIDTLAWATPDDPLARQHSVEDYRAATAGAAQPVRGFVFVETDRKHDLAAGAEEDGGGGWAGPLAEVAWLRRIAEGTPRAGEGHAPADAALVAAYVPWAPLPSGAAVLARYLDGARAAAGPTWSRVRGVRYLLQDKPDGTALAPAFVDGLRLLGRRGLVFDVGVNQHARGRIQLEETVEMIDRAHDGVPEDEQVVFILNHLCKPDLTVVNIHSDTSFIAWRTAMFTLSKCRKTYMKLSGLFSEMSAAQRAQPAEAVFEAIAPWLSVVVAAFGPARLMFGSDWPVCTAGVGDGAWRKWAQVVDRLCFMASLDDEDKKRLWAGTAIEAYGIPT